MSGPIPPLHACVDCAHDLCKAQRLRPQRLNCSLAIKLALRQIPSLYLLYLPFDVSYLAFILKIFYCNHAFHAECLGKHGVCPLCTKEDKKKSKHKATGMPRTVLEDARLAT